MTKKVRVEINPNLSPKQYLCIFIFSIVLSILFLVTAVNNYMKFKSSVKVDAVITAINVVDENDTKYIRFEYKYNDITYYNNKDINFVFNKKVGNKITLYVDPLNPSEFKDNFDFIGVILGVILCLILNFVCFKLYKNRLEM